MKIMTHLPTPRFAGRYKIVDTQGHQIAPANRMVEILSQVMKKRVWCTGPHRELLTVKDKNDARLEQSFIAIFNRIGYRLIKEVDAK